MSLVCITNDMPDIRPCTLKGEHWPNCDYLAYAYSIERNEWLPTGKPCKGCLPREARHGHLCLSCHIAWEAADSEYEAFTAAVTGIDRLVQRDNGGVASSTLGYVPLSGVALTLDELASYHRGAGPYTKGAAMQAARFTRAFAAAKRTHPTEERPHRVTRSRCTACKQLTLVWLPPINAAAQVAVTCSNPDCHVDEIDQQTFEKIEMQAAS